MVKAYLAHDGDEQWSVIYATSGAAARRYAAGEFDCRFEEVESCRRAPSLDAYGSVNMIPIWAMLELNWWAECHGCGRRISEDEDDFDQLTPVGTWSKCYCSPQCRDEKLESDLIAHDAGLLAIGTLKLWLDERFPEAEINYVHAYANDHGHVRQAFVDFDFPGSVHGGGRLDRHEGLTVCAGDYDAWRQYRGEAWAYPELPRVVRMFER